MSHSLFRRTKDFFDYITQIVDKVLSSMAWEPGVVVDEVVKNLKAKRMPPEVIVGSDGKFLFSLLRIIPAWFLDLLDSSNPNKPIPKVMKKE